MSLEELREQNKNLVAEKALACFLERGIEKTKIKDIARAAGLTERSVYRYFETKADLVQAAAYIFWRRTLKEKSQAVERSNISHMSGIEQIEILLKFYANMFFENPQGVRFTLDAELVLCNAGLENEIIARPPERFEISNSPLVVAIHQGLADGSVGKDVNVKELYYNAYDSILGAMQRLSLNATSANDLDNHLRMKHLCDVFVRAFRGD